MTIIFQMNGIELISPDYDNFKIEITNEIYRIISRIELEYGQRDPSFTSLTINFNSQEAKNTQVNELNKKILINIPSYCMNTDNNSLYQRKLNLSHELIHTITPLEKYKEVSRLEEGLATLFSENYTNCNSNPDPPYLSARNLLARVITVVPEVIKKMRNKYPLKKISEYSKNDFIDEIPPSLLDTIEELTNHFY